MYRKKNDANLFFSTSLRWFVVVTVTVAHFAFPAPIGLCKNCTRLLFFLFFLFFFFLFLFLHFLFFVSLISPFLQNRIAFDKVANVDVSALFKLRFYHRVFHVRNDVRLVQFAKIVRRLLRPVLVKVGKHCCSYDAPCFLITA